jgi:amidase
LVNEFLAADATKQGGMIRHKDLSAVEAVDLSIGAVEALNPTINAVIHPLFEKAREAARAAEGGPDRPFRGVPIVVKDLRCHTAGDPFHEGMGFLKDLGWTTPDDSFFATLLRDLGFVIIGRTNTPELGILPTTEPRAYGPTRNPWDPSRSVGGSSGGPAAAVAAGMVSVAHATDGAGSIRIPASACGLVGLKTSRGRLPLVPGFGDLMDGFVEGFLTKSVRDAAALLGLLGPPLRTSSASQEATNGWDPKENVRPLRFGILTDAPGGLAETHADCVAAVRRMAEILEELGHHVEPANVSGVTEPEAVAEFLVIGSVTQARNLDRWETTTGKPITREDVEPLTWALAELGRQTSAMQLAGAVERLRAMCEGWTHQWAGSFDILLTPAMAEPPPPLGAFHLDADNAFQPLFRAASLTPYAAPFNFTGQPAISLPVSLNAQGLPIGVQLVAGLGHDELLLRVAEQLETAAGWLDRVPNVHAVTPPG